MTRVCFPGALYYVAAYLHEVLTFIPGRRHMMAAVATFVAVRAEHSVSMCPVFHLCGCALDYTVLLRLARLHFDVRARRRVPCLHEHLYVVRARLCTFCSKACSPLHLTHSTLLPLYCTILWPDVLNGIIVVSAWRALRSAKPSEKPHAQ